MSFALMRIPQCIASSTFWVSESNFWPARMSGKRKFGWPKRQEARKHVYFFESTLQIWNERKKELSGKGHTMTNNEFAMFLLNSTGNIAVQISRRPSEGNVVEEHNYFNQGIGSQNEDQQNR